MPARTMARRWMLWLPVAGGVILVVLLTAFKHPRSELPANPISILGPSQATQIVATLDTPIEPGRNVIWCGSFLAAWKELQQSVVAGPVVLEGGSDLAERLNRAEDPRQDMPQDLCYTAAGWADQGILQRIEAEVSERFPGKPSPTFDGVVPEAVVAYANLEMYLKFPIPYFQNRQPFVFTDGGGRKSPVRSFGIRAEDDGAFRELRRQVQIIYCEELDFQEEEDVDFALDLCRGSQPNQMILARMARQETLADTWADLRARIAQYASDWKASVDAAGFPTEDDQSSFGMLMDTQIVLVPDMHWRVSHRYEELERKKFMAASRVTWLDVAQQDIEFRLDRTGAELRSEAKAYTAGASQIREFKFHRPFLVAVRKRGAATPFLLVWVDNVEVLQKWSD